MMPKALADQYDELMQAELAKQADLLEGGVDPLKVLNEFASFHAKQVDILQQVVANLEGRIEQLESKPQGLSLG